MPAQDNVIRDYLRDFGLTRYSVTNYGGDGQDTVPRSIPFARGYYWIGFRAPGNGGHAIAADTINPAMFDPNGGEGSFRTSQDMADFLGAWVGTNYANITNEWRTGFYVDN